MCEVCRFCSVPLSSLPSIQYIKKDKSRWTIVAKWTLRKLPGVFSVPCISTFDFLIWKSWDVFVFWFFVCLLVCVLRDSRQAFTSQVWNQCYARSNWTFLGIVWYSWCLLVLPTKHHVHVTLKASTTHAYDTPQDVIKMSTDPNSDKGRFIG